MAERVVPESTRGCGGRGMTRVFRLQLACTDCGHQSQMTATELDPYLEVECPKCGTRLGTWGDLAFSSEPEPE